MSPEIRGKIYITVFAVTALGMGLIFWTNYRPKILMAKCSDIAQKATEVQTRVNLPGNKLITDYDTLLNECLNDFGYKLSQSEVQ